MWRESVRCPEVIALHPETARSAEHPDVPVGSFQASAEGEIPLSAPSLEALPPQRLRAMLLAGVEALECQRVLRKGGLNLVGEVLRGQGEFIEFEHYPKDDVYDADSRSQYYYHSHRGGTEEHGHFHTFIRDPVDDRTTHLVAISMDAWGWPIGLFAVNRWVTDEKWRPAADVLHMMRRFRIDHAYPSWPVNRWLNAMLVLFQPHVEALLHHRDRVVASWAAAHPEVDVFEDRNLEVTGYLPISVDDTVSEVRRLLKLG